MQAAQLSTLCRQTDAMLRAMRALDQVPLDDLGDAILASLAQELQRLAIYAACQCKRSKRKPKYGVADPNWLLDALRGVYAVQ